LSRLPVIAGFGGINSAGRGSFHHAYRRMVIDGLEPSVTNDTYLGLATLMGYLTVKDGKYFDNNGSECSPNQVKEKYGPEILGNTCLRKIDTQLLDVDNVLVNKKVQFNGHYQQPIRLTLSKRQLPARIPENWLVKELNTKQVEITIQGGLECLVPDLKKSLVQTAGQLPTGFDPGKTYPSMHHPRGLQLAVTGVSDAIRSMGIDWSAIKDTVQPNEIGVYAGSAMGQLDQFGGGGFLKAPSNGVRTTSKQIAFHFPQMVADFINAYVLGSVGFTGGQAGACATALYSLNAAVSDIQSGKRRVAIVGTSEAPINYEVIEGYRSMTALAEDAQILELDKKLGLTKTDHQRACRPFADNCGFTLAESAQFFVLFDEALALELGANICGSIGNVFINADGYKKSISAPGFGNYVTLSQSISSAQAFFGENRVQTRSFVHAHGTGTPQNRVTESHALNEVAKAFGISNWPVSAIKCYIGHSIGTAAGDQLNAALGTWQYGLIPGIFTMDQIAQDVEDSNLYFCQKHLDVGADKMDMAFINTKGFGGNNATGMIISPDYTKQMITKKYGEKIMMDYRKKNERVVEQSHNYDQRAISGDFTSIYHFGKNVLEGDQFNITDQSMNIPGFSKSIDLKMPALYPEMKL
jgi:acetoacetyl-[acyl-carrier protein] synthase